MSNTVKGAGTSYRLAFDPHMTKADQLKQAIEAVISHLGCSDCGRISQIDVHVAEQDVKLSRQIPGLLKVTEIKGG
jgi:hypothetical protein